jgi:two-component system response regulator AtoC
MSKGRTLAREDFPELADDTRHENTRESLWSGGRTESGTFLTLDEIEEIHIRRVIKETNKNKGEICEILGISRPTFERKLEKYNIIFERD